MRRELSCKSVHKLRHSKSKEDERQRLKTQTCDTTFPGHILNSIIMCAHILCYKSVSGTSKEL